MIPEEDEERIKTEYESSRKFFDPKNRESSNFFNVGNTMRKSINTKESLHLKTNLKQTFDTVEEKEEKEIDMPEFENFQKMIQEKLRKNSSSSKTNLETSSKSTNERIIFSPHMKFKIKTENSDKAGGIDYYQKTADIEKAAAENKNKGRHRRQLSREKSTESISTSEYTNDSAKNRRILNISKENSRGNTPHDIFDFSKLTGKNNTLSLNSGGNESSRNEDVSTPNRKNIIESDYLIRKNDSSGNKQNHSSRSNTRREIFSSNSTATNYNNGQILTERSRSNKPIRLPNGDSVKVNLTHKPYTPPDVKLPTIGTSRRISKPPEMKEDLKNIFDAANNYKEDPVIKKKLDDIMQNIVDIRNVLSQKNKSRVKIASAPANFEETNIDSILNGKNNLFSGAPRNKNLSHFPENERVKATFTKVSSANSNLKGTRKLYQTNGVINTKLDPPGKEKASLLPNTRDTKDKHPIKLIKK